MKSCQKKQGIAVLYGFGGQIIMQKPFRWNLTTKIDSPFAEVFLEGYERQRIFLSLSYFGQGGWNTNVLLLTGDYRESFLSTVRESVYFEDSLKDGEKHEIPAEENSTDFINDILGDYFTLRADSKIFAIYGPQSVSSFLYDTDNSLYRTVYRRIR